MSPRSLFSSSLLWLAACSLTNPALAQDDAKSKTAPAAKESTGILPIPDYSGDWMKRMYLTGNWGGTRTDLADHGVQIDLAWNQYVQGITNGGKDGATRYGGNLVYEINLDLMRMGVLPGALIQFRAESRYGSSVNGNVGTIMAVNTDAFFPLTSPIDEEIPITVTDLNYVQFLSANLGVIVGKIDTLSGDPNEFSSGRGTSQFMNANFVFNATLALRMPYSTLGAGVIWMPIPNGPEGGITVTNMVMNTVDSSTTTGFDDFGKGGTWNGEADFQYRLGDLPGGMNVGFLYSFDQDFTQLNSRLIFQPGQGFSIPTQNDTWAVYWSAWQYVSTKDKAHKTINLADGEAHEQGFGFFARYGFADKTTNPIEWAVSGGIGGRGLLPSRDNDDYGFGYFFNSIQQTKVFDLLGIQSASQGFEWFYDVAVTPACHVTLDVQVVEASQISVPTATVLGLRASMNF